MLNRHFTQHLKLLTLAAVSGVCAGCVVPSISIPTFGLHSLGASRTMAVPDVMPLGTISRAHWHMMETNGEATDFVIHRNEFVDNSSELSPYGRDHVAEIAARMSSAPFPVLVQRSENNSDPELDAARRQLVARVLTDLGNPDADHRTIVSQPYSNGINAIEGERDYSNYRYSGSNQGNQGNGGGFGGGGGGF